MLEVVAQIEATGEELISFGGALSAGFADRTAQYLGPDRGLTRSMYLKDPDSIQIELLAEPLRIMDDRYLG